MIRQSKAVSAEDSSAMKKGVPKPISDTPCKYKPRTCYQPALDNYDYCSKHILEDKHAPYRSCCYTYSTNNKRCFLPGETSDIFHETYCPLHFWKTKIKNRNTSTCKTVPPITPEYLLSTLSHYIRPVRRAIDEGPSTSRNRVINPFVEIDVNRGAQARDHVLECVSESDSDVEPASLDNLWNGANEDSSDAESVDSQLDDPLRYAGHYTAEEAVNTLKSKLTMLQTLYQKQFDRLQYIYREKKRNYYLALKKEKETLSSIHDQAKSSAREQKLYEKLKSLKKYHRRSKAETIKHNARIIKRLKEHKGNDYKGQQQSKCSFTEGGVRCSNVIIPLTKFCFDHILEDRNQCLYKECGCVKADINCRVPVLGIGCDETCILHARLPVLPHSNYPDMRIEFDDGDKRSNDESEIDASATESAFSTDQRDSPENSIINNEDLPHRRDEELFVNKNSYPEAELRESIIDKNVDSDYEKVIIKSDRHEPLDDVHM